MLDTKSFILRTGVRTFEAAAFLRRMGADTVAVRKLFASSMESYQERSRLVSAAEVYRGCAISGHLTMAGAQIKDITLEDCRQQLLVAIDRYYEENPKGGKDA